MKFRPPFTTEIIIKEGKKRVVMGESIGWLGLYSDMSKVGNVNLPGREIDKHDENSG